MAQIIKKYPLVSVVCAAYNEERNIARLLESINLQTYPNVESIVVDDESSDGTVQIALPLATVVYKRKHNERSTQRNYGGTKAKGAYLLFVDADMELSPTVLANCVRLITKSDYKALVIPEVTTGTSLLARVRRFEREMYEGDRTIEVARFFDKQVFVEFGGYDPELTGAEDYDLPKRVSAKYTIGRISAGKILHHEQQRTLYHQLRRKYYYAKNSYKYADKHPDLVPLQGNLLFRKAYFKNWRKFVQHPFLGLTFLCVRLLETVFAVSGYIRAVGWRKFGTTFLRMLRQ